MAKRNDREKLLLNRGCGVGGDGREDRNQEIPALKGKRAGKETELKRVPSPLSCEMDQLLGAFATSERIQVHF